MKREELEHAILTASRIVNQNEVLVIGSQSILGSYREEELPPKATMSAEVDIAPLKDIHDHLADRIMADAGQGSEFEVETGYYIDGVSLATAVLPDGWRDRLVRVEIAEAPGVAGLCLDPHDLCASKLARNEDKDREFVTALINAGLIDPRLLRNRIDAIPDDRLEPARKRVLRRFAMSAQDRRRSDRRTSEPPS